MSLPLAAPLENRPFSWADFLRLPRWSTSDSHRRWLFRSAAGEPPACAGCSLPRLPPAVNLRLAPRIAFSGCACGELPTSTRPCIVGRTADEYPVSVFHCTSGPPAIRPRLSPAASPSGLIPGQRSTCAARCFREHGWRGASPTFIGAALVPATPATNFRCPTWPSVEETMRLFDLWIQVQKSS